MERRRCKRKAHRINSHTNRKILRISLCHLSPAEIKSKFKLSRCVRKSGAFKRPISLDEKSIVKVDGTLAQRGLEQAEVRQQVFFNARHNTYIGTYNTRTLKAKWRRHELICYCESKGIEVLASKNIVLFSNQMIQFVKKSMGTIGSLYTQQLMRKVVAV